MSFTTKRDRTSATGVSDIGKSWFLEMMKMSDLKKIIIEVDDLIE